VFPANINKAGSDDDIDAFTQMIAKARHSIGGLMKWWEEQAKGSAQPDKPGPSGVATGAPPKEKREGTSFAVSKRPSTPEKKPVIIACPNCGNEGLTRFGPMVKCGPCGWSKRMED
jgi:predicted RNA-binding Zn-ribbon protein involved in translation (DUF1610 family)